MTYRNMRLLLVGAGFIAKVHAAAAKNQAAYSFVGVVDTDIDRANILASEYQIEPYQSLKNALDSLSPQGVVICVPTDCHLDVIKICAQYKVAIFCEKPLALNISEANQIASLIESTGTRIMIGHVTRFWPCYLEVLEYARTGLYGDIRSLHLERLSAPPLTNNWIVDVKRGGGAVFDLQIHDFDFVQQLLGTPVSMSACSDLNEEQQHNSVFNILRFANGQIVTNKASFTMPQSYLFRSCFRIEFDGAVVEMDSCRTDAVLRVYPSCDSVIIPVLPKKSPFAEEMAYFVDQVKNNGEFSKNTFHDSLTSLYLCCRSHDSLTQRHEVHV